MADRKEFNDYQLWLNAAMESGYKVEAHTKDPGQRVALTDGREERGSYHVGGNRGDLEALDTKDRVTPRQPAQNAGSTPPTTEDPAQAQKRPSVT